MNLDEKQIFANVQAALSEDLGEGDVSAALLPEGLKARAEIISREPMLVCGQPWVNAVFRELDPLIEIHWLVKEGQYLEKPSTLCHLEGLARSILSAERTALNFLQTLSGTATQTQHYVKAMGKTKTRLLDTRKTLPGLRYAQKYAVATGGGHNHRMGLYDAFLIKENHIAACGSLVEAVKKARASSPGLFLEVEVESIAELQMALTAQPDRILLDNFTEAMVRDAIVLNNPPLCELELSGGIHLANIGHLASLGLDYISVGAITKSVQAIDLSLLLHKDEIEQP